MRHVRAFTLLEIVIYLTLFIGVSLLVMQFSINSYRHMRFLDCEINELLSKALVFDVVFRDVLRSSPNIFDWEKERFIFRSRFYVRGEIVTKDVGFISDFEGERILRYEGKYDFINRSWKNKVTSVVFVGNIEEGLSHRLIQKGGYVRAIEVCFGGDIQVIRLRNGYVQATNGLHPSTSGFNPLSA